MKPNALALAVLTAALVLSGCKDSAKPGAQTAPSAPALTEAATGEPAVAPVDPLTVSVPPGFGAEIRVAPVGATPLSDTLRVAGKVDFDETRVTRIGATVTGRVIEIHAQLGQQVKVGDALAVINSTELGQAQLAYLKARAQALAEQHKGFAQALGVRGIPLLCVYKGGELVRRQPGAVFGAELENVVAPYL